MTYFNDSEAFPCAWLARLFPEAHIDERSIRDVQPRDIATFRRVHLFAGIGGWEYALRLAGWPDDREVWTGSCPCQPFSQAGKRRGEADERHLWPEMRRLIAECRPATIFGEQVASRAGREWLSGVRADLEELGYEVGAADLCAAGVAAPHIRQRLYWVADSQGDRWQQRRSGSNVAREAGWTTSVCASSWLVQSDRAGRDSGVLAGEATGHGGTAIAAGGGTWSDYYVAHCTDGKARRIGTGVQPLAHGVPGRVGLLRAYGNAIVPPLAATFVRAFLDAENPRISEPAAVE